MRGRRATQERALRTLFATPSYLLAAFLHLLLIFVVSLWTVAAHLEEERLPIAVGLIESREVVLSQGAAESDLRGQPETTNGERCALAAGPRRRQRLDRHADRIVADHRTISRHR